MSEMAPRASCRCRSLYSASSRRSSSSRFSLNRVGELGNLGFLRPNYAKAVADVVKELGGIPFLTDCNTLYPGSRKNAIEHMYCAWENGFTPLTVGCPVIIGDGLKGTDDIEVPVEGGEYVKNAKIGRAIMLSKRQFQRGRCDLAAGCG